MIRRMLALLSLGLVAACDDAPPPALHIPASEKISLDLADGRVVRRSLAFLATAQPRDMAEIPLGHPKPAEQTVYGPLLVGWQLRGAVSGRAWIIAPEQPGLGLQEIIANRDYPILGTVSAIFPRGDAWYIQTSHGWLTGQADPR